MKITKRQLKRIIKEEKTRLLREGALEGLGDYFDEIMQYGRHSDALDTLVGYLTVEDAQALGVEDTYMFQERNWGVFDLLDTLALKSPATIDRLAAELL